jgi:hypothetical protein
MKSEQDLSGGRHLTLAQREDIVHDLEGSTAGPPVTMAAEAADQEAVRYEGEIASVLEDMGCEVKIDNVMTNTPAQTTMPAGVEVTVKENTVRPIHSNRIIRAFRRAGVALSTRINAARLKNDTLYITVGPNDAPPVRAGWKWWF